MSTPILRSGVLAATLVALAVAATPAPATEDFKVVSAAECQPYAPDTTRDELSYSPTGIYNGGATNEKVLCTLPRDQEAVYHAHDLEVTVSYRVIGGTASRMTCTLYLGNTTTNTDAVTTSTVAGPLVSGGGRALLLFDAGAQPFDFTATTTTMICVLPPKVSFGSVRIKEVGATHVD